MKDADENLIQNTLPELKRGLLTLAVLELLHAEQYGYSLQKELAERGFEVEQGTLYPLLRRLEGQGWLSSDWRLADETRPRRYYQTNAAGKEALKELYREWTALSAAMAALFEGKELNQ